MATIKARDIVPPVTVELFLHHNYPVEAMKNQWVVVQNKQGAKYQQTTHKVGRLTENDTTNFLFHIYGGPYVGTGLGPNFRSRGENITALLILPWNYVKSLWVLDQKEIPMISEKHGRLSIIKTKVTF